MRCPVCRDDMIVLEYKGIEIDYCMDCGGVWFDRDELEYLLSTVDLTLESLNIKTAGRDETRKAGETIKRCPLCRRKMKKYIIGQADPVIIDRCENHGGYWFDGGELPHVVKSRMEEDEWRNVTDFLSIFFPPEKKEE